MNILFCEIKGVLCTHKHNLKLSINNKNLASYNMDCILDPEAVNLLNKYCWENKINLVFLSTWAKTIDSKKGIELLKSKGIKTPILSIEPFFMESNIDKVVNDWLDNNKKDWISEIKWNAITNYTNDGKLFDITKQIDKPIISCSYNGLTKEVLNKLVY